MTDHKFTDAEIVKALECCNAPGTCCECPYYGENEVEYDDKCVQKLTRDVLPLINRQKVEIEKLGRDRYQILPDGRLELLPRTDINAIKAEAIKEFAERLVAIYENDKTYDRPNAHTLVVTVFRNIDTLVKEMTEGKENESKST